MHGILLCMGALPENDRIRGPLVAEAGQTDFPSDFPLIREDAIFVEYERAGSRHRIRPPELSVVLLTDTAFTVRVPAMQAGDRVWIVSAIPAERTMAHTPYGAIRTLILEGDALSTQAQLQELQREVNRALRVPYGEQPPAADNVLPVATALEAIANKAGRANFAAMRKAPAADQVIVCTGRTASGDHYAGTFVWMPGDHSAKVAADPMQAIWVAPDYAPSGALGARRRVFDGPLDPAWFGGKTSAAVQAALNYAKATGEREIRASGSYHMISPVNYRGHGGHGFTFDARAVRFTRRGDYGPTFLVAGQDDGSALQRVSFRAGGFQDLDESMTHANSPAHVIFDHVYFLEWDVAYIRGGTGGVHLRGCAQTRCDNSGQAWRFEGPYRGDQSAGFYVGPSQIPAANGYGGGDHTIAGLPDVYAGQMIGHLKVAANPSATQIVLDGVEGVAIGDIVTGHGLSGHTGYEYFQRDTAITAIDPASRTITLSKPVSSAPWIGYALAIFRPTLAYAYEFAGADGLWANGATGHAILARRANIRIHTAAGIKVENHRISAMSDYTCGKSVLIDGDGLVGRGAFDLHHCYGTRANVEIGEDVTLDRFAVLSMDEGWSLGGFAFGGEIGAPSVLLSRPDGTPAFRVGVDENGVMQLTGTDTSGDPEGSPILEVNRGSRTIVSRQEITLSGRSVAELSDAPMTFASPGTVALCYNVRRLKADGALEGPGEGGISLVCKQADGTWFLAGTSIEAQA